MRAPGLLRRVGANAGRLVRIGIARGVLPRRRRYWLVLRLTPPLDELRPPALPWSREAPLGLLDVLRVLERAAVDPDVGGVLVRLGGAPAGLARARAVRRALEAVRAAGKPVAAYGERIGIQELALAAGASRLWLPEAGSVQLLGLRAEGVYVGRLLERLAVRPEVVRVGAYKSAGEAFTRDGMSPEQREQAEALLDDWYGEVVEAIARGRGLAEGDVRDRIDRGPYLGAAAVEAGLADACRFPDELDDAVAELDPASRGSDGRVRFVEAAVYARLRAGDAGWQPWIGDLPHVAYVVATGVIHRGASLAGIAVDPLRDRIERLSKDGRVRGIVLRLVSPGGDALASDLLWRAIRLAREEKPVVVSMGEVAASGGYFVAAAADAILAEAETVTGSIGVVGGKLDLSGLYERLGIARAGVERGRRAGLLSEARGFTSDERAALRDELRALYGIFVRRVAEGRGLAHDAVERLARGRIWSGRQAERLGLVDRLGGPLEAIDEVRRRIGLATDARAVIDVHPRRGSLEGLRWMAHWGLQGPRG